MSHNIQFTRRIRYRFDNLMARGTGSQILLLAVTTLVLVLVTALALISFGVVPESDGGPESFGELLWRGLMHALDAGAVGGDAGTWTFRFIMLAVTIGGLFVLSALIGILNNGFGALIEGLRRGRSAVIERGHTVILGHGPKIRPLLLELAEAAANQRGACVVVLADRDKVAMDEEVAELLAGKRLRVVTRSGSPMSIEDLQQVSLATSKAVVVLGPESYSDGSAMASHESDTAVLKTLLAATKVAGEHALHIVAEIQDEKTEAVARMVVGEKASLIVGPQLVSRLLVQTGRQSGLSIVYTELLDFGGVEIYLAELPALTGRSFRDAVFAFDDSALMGVLTATGELLLPPPFERPMAAGDRVVALSQDDDTVVLNGRPVALSGDVIAVSPRQPTRHRERTLVLGGSTRLELVLRELDSYVATGSETLVVGDAPSLADFEASLGGLRNMKVSLRPGDVTDRRLLDRLDATGFDHILVLSESAGRSQEMADARTMITLLHLRDISRRAGRSVPITSEILDIQNRDLAAVAEADDFIVSNTLVSLLVSQISENHHLVRVFGQLFSAGGHEIYLKPVTEYVRLGVDMPYQAVVEAALRRGEVALGYRSAASASDPSAGYGVQLTPAKSATVRFAAGDKVVVMAEE